MIKRLSRSVGILAKVKPFLNTKALLNLYYAIFHSHLQYVLITRSSTFKSYLKLSILQNKAVKIVGGGKYYDRATQFYAKLRILKLVDIIFFEKALFVFKFKMKMLPDQFNNYLTEASHAYEKFTRASYQNNNYSIPLLNTSKAQRSIKYQGPLIWNALDADLKTCKTLQSFKAKLKNLLFQKYDQET